MNIRYGGRYGGARLHGAAAGQWIIRFVLTCIAASAIAGELPDSRWDLLAVAYPPDKEISVALGGAEKTLSSKGLARVKWQKNAASIELEIKGMPDPNSIGWTGRQYVLWAIDREKQIVNLGALPMRGNETKMSATVPFRVFGLLVTAETDPKSVSPSNAVALESLLPTNPNLIIPVFRVEVPLTSNSG
jgi:hypothetical protein